MNDVTGKWSVSGDEEAYFGTFETPDEAIEDGRKTYEGTFWIGQCVAPAQPETLFNEYSVDRWLECDVLGHDDYLGDWAEDSMIVESKHRKELAEEIRPVIAAWLDRNNLRPTHWNVNPETVRKIDV